MKQKNSHSIFYIFQYFWPHIKPYRFIGAGFILFSVLLMAIDLSQAYLLQNLIDSALAMKRILLLQ